MAELKSKRPEIRVFAGPDGSGKSTFTTPDNIIPPYFNADDVVKEKNISNLEAAIEVDNAKRKAISNMESFTFETVLSKERNLLLLQQAHDTGYFIRCIFVLTVDPELNVMRVRARVINGGHPVPEDKIVSRYYKSISNIPKLIKVCNRLSIYDNTGDTPLRIYKNKDGAEYFFPNDLWSQDEIISLVTKGLAKQ